MKTTTILYITHNTTILYILQEDMKVTILLDLKIRRRLPYSILIRTTARRYEGDPMWRYEDNCDTFFGFFWLIQITSINSLIQIKKEIIYCPHTFFGIYWLIQDFKYTILYIVYIKSRSRREARSNNR